MCKCEMVLERTNAATQAGVAGVVATLIGKEIRGTGSQRSAAKFPPHVLYYGMTSWSPIRGWIVPFSM